MSDTTEYPSIRDALMEATAADTGAPEADAGAMPEPAALAEVVPETEAAARQRDEHGRFARKDAPAADAMAAAPMAEPVGEKPVGNTLAETAPALSPVEQVLAPYREQLERQYGGTQHWVAHMAALSQQADADPVGFIRRFAQERGVDLARIHSPAAAPQHQAPADPVAARVDEILRERDVDRAHAEFMADTSLEHRGNRQVQLTMAALINAGRARDYRGAYEIAVQADPDIGPKLRAAEAAKQAQAGAAQRAQDVTVKKAAAVSVTGAPGTTRAAPTNGAGSSIRAALDAAWSEQTARA